MVLNIFADYLKENMERRQFIRSYSLFITGLYFLALGIVLIVRSALGTTPISSANYVLSINTPWSLGVWTLININIFILLQLMLLRKDNPNIRKQKLEIWLQLPFSFLFSAFIDLNMILTASVAPSMYLSCIVLLLMGCFVQAVGVVLELKGHVVIMSAEGLVARIADRVNAVFGYVKIGVDVTLVLIAVILSWFLSGRIEGGREGTVIAALLTGYIVKVLASQVMTRKTIEKIRMKLHVK